MIKQLVKTRNENEREYLGVTINKYEIAQLIAKRDHGFWYGYFSAT